MTAPIDLTRERFGRLTVVNLESPGPRMWNCKCDCGRSTTVAAAHLRSGHTKSCGCLRGEERAHSLVTHGKRSTPEYRIWAAMRYRCSQTNDPSFRWYGERGIGVCPEWKTSFQRFWEDMGPRPSAKHTIERVDVRKGYSKDNCIWTDDAALQAFNQGLKSNNSTGKSGVYWRKDRKRWVAKIFAEGRTRTLGSFHTKEEAIERREAAEVRYYGRKKPDRLGHILPGHG